MGGSAGWHGGSEGGKQLVWLLAARMKIHHRWNGEAWDPSLYATTRLCEEMSTCFSSLLKQLVTSCLSVGGKKKKKTKKKKLGGVGGNYFLVGELHHKQRNVQEKATKQWNGNWKQTNTFVLGSCRVTRRECTVLVCTFQHLALSWVIALQPCPRHPPQPFYPHQWRLCIRKCHQPDRPFWLNYPFKLAHALWSRHGLTLARGPYEACWAF